MKTFEIKIIETLSRSLEINAQSEDEALYIANQMYKDEDVILDSDDHSETLFQYIQPIFNE